MGSWFMIHDVLLDVGCVVRVVCGGGFVSFVCSSLSEAVSLVVVKKLRLCVPGLGWFLVMALFIIPGL
jgi:hypothetical protein